MGQVKIRCPLCGERRFRFTFKNEAAGTPHGAICWRCGEQVKPENLYRLFLVVSNPDKNSID